jgi:hypothetical protein
MKAGGQFLIFDSPRRPAAPERERGGQHGESLWRSQGFQFLIGM